MLPYYDDSRAAWSWRNGAALGLYPISGGFLRHGRIAGRGDVMYSIKKNIESLLKDAFMIKM